MIISASRRTDLPAFFSEWLLARLAGGLALVPHPWRPGQITRVPLSPDTVDCLVFWTKNPEPLRLRLKAVEALGYRRYYFTFTLTPYGPELEPNLPPKAALLETFERLSDRIGPRRLDWRYDPIVVDEKHPVQWHLDHFGRLGDRLRGRADRCLISFFKNYRHLRGRLPEAGPEAIEKLAAGLAAIAAELSLPLFHCTERLDLRHLGIRPAACIDRGKIEDIMNGSAEAGFGDLASEQAWGLTGPALNARKDPGQPKTCLCLKSVDLGVYNTCAHGCLYCYAVRNPVRARQFLAKHDPAALTMTGER